MIQIYSRLWNIFARSWNWLEMVRNELTNLPAIYPMKYYKIIHHHQLSGRQNDINLLWSGHARNEFRKHLHLNHNESKISVFNLLRIAKRKMWGKKENVLRIRKFEWTLSTTTTRKSLWNMENLLQAIYHADPSLCWPLSSWIIS